MYQVGDTIIYGQTGVCTIEDIGHPSGVESKKLYYTLKPYSNQGMIYVPVDTANYLRKIISPKEAENLIRHIPEIPDYVCADSRAMAQKEFYSKALHSHDFTVLIGVIKGLYHKSQRNLERKKPLSSTETYFMKLAENCVHQEFAVSLGVKVEQVPGYVQSIIQNSP